MSTKINYFCLYLVVLWVSPVPARSSGQSTIWHFHFPQGKVWPHSVWIFELGLELKVKLSHCIANYVTFAGCVYRSKLCIYYQAGNGSVSHRASKHITILRPCNALTVMDVSKSSKLCIYSLILGEKETAIKAKY